MDILVLGTVILSAIVAMFSAFGYYYWVCEKTIEESFDEFIYSFLGGLLGGFIGVITGFIIGYICYSLGFFQPDFGLPNLRIIWFYLISLCVGVLIGGIITIKPLIKFFSDN